MDRGLAADLDRARRLILSGAVIGDERRVDRASERFAETADLRVRGRGGRFVSRAGSKLDHALERFGIVVEGRRCLDVGIGTGGFTDCLLQRGAAQVTGVDVGYGDVAWSIRSDPRVTLRERTNFRTLDPTELGDPFDVVVVDCSFISLVQLMTPLSAALGRSGDLVALVKPQFEVPAADVMEGGRVEDERARDAALERVRAEALSHGIELRGAVDSPTPGRVAGNVELLAWLTRGSAT